MLSTEKSCQISPKHKGYFFYFTIFCFELIYFAALTNKKLLLPLKCGLKQIFSLDIVKFIEYLASAVIVVLSDPCIGLSPRTKISFLLLSIRTDELLSTPKIITFFAKSKFECEESEQESNPIPYPG